MKQKQIGTILASGALLLVVAIGLLAVGCQKQQDTAQTSSNPQTPSQQAADSPPKTPIADTNSPLYGWEKFSSADGKFSAIFPSRPKERDESGKGAGGTVQGRSFSASTDKQTSYSVVYYDIPNVNDPKMMLARVEQSIVTGENAKITSYKAMQVGDHYATQFEIIPGGNPNLSGTVRLIAVGQRIYMLMATYFTGHPNADERDAFLDSFALLN
jgi:hypothetical protein